MDLNVKCTGGCCSAFNADKVIAPGAICTDSTLIIREEGDIPHAARCVFNRHGNACYFDGECERKRTLGEQK